MPPARSGFRDPAAWWMLAGAYGFSWSVALGLWATGGIPTGWRHVVGGFLFMCGPALSALVVRWWKGKQEGDFPLRPRLDRWLAVAWVIPLALVLVATVASALVPGVELLSPVAALRHQLVTMGVPEQADKLAQIPAPLLSVLLGVQAAVMGPLLNAPFMLSEELGWRGLLWSRWREVGFWRGCAATGFFWGLWHAPLIAMGHNYPDAPLVGIPTMVLFCMLLTPVLHLVRERGGTLWHACLFHGTVNAVTSLATLCLLGGSSLLRGIVGLPGLTTLAVSVLLVYLWRRKMGLEA